MTWTNYHSHCDFCDGSAPAERFVLEAIAQGLSVYGFSSHAPLPVERPWAMRKERLPEYIQLIQGLRQQYGDRIEVLAGLEMDFLPGVSWWDFHGQVLRGLDYTIGSIHVVESMPDGSPWEVDHTAETWERGLQEVFQGDVRAAMARYFELMRWMLMLENPDILGHMDKPKIHNVGGRYFREEDEWYRKEVEKTLKVVLNMGTVVEVNTRGLYTGKVLDLYPSQWILERMAALRIPVMVNSDAHRPEEIRAGFEFAAKSLLRAGYREVTILSGGKWRQVPIQEAGLGHVYAPKRVLRRHDP